MLIQFLHPLVRSCLDQDGAADSLGASLGDSLGASLGAALCAGACDVVVVVPPPLDEQPNRAAAIARINRIGFNM
jgi:hypothetical protein